MTERMPWGQLKQLRARNTDAQATYTRTLTAIAFGRLVWQRRRNIGLTEAALARRIGTDPVTVERIELGDADVPTSMLLRAAKALDIDPEVVPGNRTGEAPSGAESWVLIADLLNADGEEYHAYFILAAHPVSDGYFVHSPLEGEILYSKMGRDHALQAAAQRIIDLAIGAANSGNLERLLGEHGIVLHEGPPPGRKQPPQPRPEKGWSARAVTSVA